MKQFGWRGISLNIPPQWELLKLGGNDNNGFVSLGDNLKINLELKWKYSRFNLSISKILDKFLYSIEKKAKQKKENYKFNKDIDLSDKSKSLSYEWKTDSVSAVGVIWHCDQCKRVVLVQLLNQNLDLTKKILEDLKCHEDGEERLWSVYNLSFILPNVWKLRNYIFKSGYLKFLFVKHNEELSIERWGFARSLMSNTSLENWFKCFYKERFKENSLINNINLNGHNGLNAIFTPRKKGFFSLKTIVSSFYIWYCEDSNRIFVIGESSTKPNEILLNNLIKSIKCH
jgi:hypothetical protein